MRDRFGVEIVMTDRVRFGPDAPVPLGTTGVIVGVRAGRIVRQGDRANPRLRALAYVSPSRFGDEEFDLIASSPVELGVLRRDGDDEPSIYEGRTKKPYPYPLTTTVAEEAALWRVEARDRYREHMSEMEREHGDRRPRR